MRKVVKAIDITFENLDSIVIPVEYFYDFSINDIRTSISHMSTNAILRTNVAGSLMFILKKKADKDADKFRRDVHIISTKTGTLFERIYKSDITSFTIIYEDDSSEEFYIPWEDDGRNEYKNILQKTSKDDKGNLIVRIERN